MKALPVSILSDIEHNSDLVVGHKYNGFSERLVVKDGVIKLFNRSGSEQTENVPHITALSAPQSMDLILWAEGLAPNGRLESAKSIFGSSPSHALEWQRDNGLAGLVVVNIAKYNGECLSHIPFGERLELLTQAVERLQVLGVANIRQEILVSKGKDNYFKNIISCGGEGVVVKKLSGLESDWFKVKKTETWDAVIVGFTQGKGKYRDVIGAIRYGFYDYTGNLREAGKCSGMTDADRVMLASAPEAFIGMVVEICGQELGNRGGIIFPRFIRIRDDKLPIDCLVPGLGKLG